MKIFLSALLLGMVLILSCSHKSCATVKCLCQDKTIQVPDCGICGSQLGTMEKTDVGAICFCYNKLKSQEITCSEVCEQHTGWTGEFAQE
jgi:hypothetical protein